VLPEFVPTRDDPQAWIDEITRLTTELEWNEAYLMTKIPGCFKGETSEWFSGWCPIDGRTWANLKRDVCVKFSGVVNRGQLLHDAVTYNSEGCPSYGQYARIKLQKIEATRVPFTQN
jgi:hypothetical protein